MVTDKQNLPQVRGEYKFNEPLKKYVWLNVGGPADVLFLPKDEKDLQNFLKQKPENLPVFILGGGSNLLVRDGGIAGAVIKLGSPAFAEYKIENEVLNIGGGFKNFALKNILLENELGGLEFICSIPGSIGGLVRSNAGCFGSDLAQVLLKAKVMNGKGDIFEVLPADFNFSYRNSNFPEDWIVLELSLKTKKTPAAQIEKIISDNFLYRKERQPQGVRTAGSTFKNTPDAPAWKLIKQSGGNELKIGGASLSDVHCNFMVNDGTASAADLENLGEEVRRLVKKQTGVALDWEVKIIGRKNGND